MKASAIEFRLRMIIQIVIVFLAVWAPWIQPWDIKLRMSTLEWLSLQIGRTGLVTFAIAVPIVIIFGTVLAALGAWLRVWGAAYLGYDVVHDSKMQAGGVMAAGPYRYVRNPLYLGGWFMMAAISLLITPSGALFMDLLIAIFYLRLILGEEPYLSAKLGEPYQQYLSAVPRFIPRLRTSNPAVPSNPRWLMAVLTEITAVGSFITIATVPWTYNNIAALDGVLISFVVSLIIRGLIQSPIPTCVFLAIGCGSWALAHLSIQRAVLIGFGSALIVWAITPHRAEPESESASSPESPSSAQ